MQSDNIQQKQKYLRENILQSGYDPSDFIVFLQQNQNIDHIDIQGWSMKKIQHLVGAYKQYKYYTSQKKQPTQTMQSNEKRKIFTQRQSKANKQSLQKEIQSSIALLSNQGGKMVYEKQKMTFYQEQKNRIEYPRYAPLFDYQFKAKCKCVLADNLIAQAKGLQIQIPKFQLVQSSGIFLGFGSKTQVWFTIKSNIKKQTTVRRILSDFDWLSAILIRLYPYLALPELVQYKKDVQNPNERRRHQIEQYMRNLTDRQVLMRSNIFYDFLTVHSDKMEKLKKSYDSIGFTKGISMIKSPQGQIQVQYTKKSRQYEQSCHNYSKKVSAIHQKFPQTITKTIQSLDVVVNNLNYLVDYFAQIHQAYNQLMNKFPQYKSVQYNQVLINLNNLFHGISDNIRSHSHNLQKHMKDYFKFNILNDKNIMRLERYVKQEQKNYLQYKYNLTRKKQRLLLQPQKWDIDFKNLSTEQIGLLKQDKQKAFQIMLPRETLQENQIKSWVAFLYTQFVKEFDIYIKQSTWRYAEKYKALATDLLNRDKNYLESLTRFLTESRKLTK